MLRDNGNHAQSPLKDKDSIAILKKAHLQIAAFQIPKNLDKYIYYNILQHVSKIQKQQKILISMDLEYISNVSPEAPLFAEEN